jgi:hypothetical protein
MGWGQLKNKEDFDKYIYEKKCCIKTNWNKLKRKL